MIRRATRWFSTLVMLVVMMLVVASILPVGGILYRVLLVADPPRPADAIVVLGGGVFDADTATTSTAARLVHGLRLYRRGYAPLVILSGGNPIDPRLPESVVMRKIAEELGAPPNVLLVETEAARTATQGDAVARIARARGIRTILLVTSPEHSRRAAHVFRKTGLTVISTPVARQRPPKLSIAYHPLEIMKRMTALLDFAYEGAATALYWWRGWW